MIAATTVLFGLRLNDDLWVPLGLAGVPNRSLTRGLIAFLAPRQNTAPSNCILTRFGLMYASAKSIHICRLDASMTQSGAHHVGLTVAGHRSVTGTGTAQALGLRVSNSAFTLLERCPRRDAAHPGWRAHRAVRGPGRRQCGGAAGCEPPTRRCTRVASGTSRSRSTISMPPSPARAAGGRERRCGHTRQSPEPGRRMAFIHDPGRQPDRADRTTGMTASNT